MQDHFHFRAIQRESREMEVPLIVHSPQCLHQMTKKERHVYPLTLLPVNSSLYQVMLLMFAKDLCSTVIIADNLSSDSFKPFMKHSHESPEVYIHSKKQIVLSNTKHECMTALCSRRSPLVIIRSFQYFI